MTLANKKYQLKAEQYYAVSKKMPERVKQIRESRAISKHELSRISGVDRASIVKMEVGITKPSGERHFVRPKTKTLCKIAAALRTTPAYLEYGAYSIIDKNLIELCNILLKLNVTKRKKFINDAILKLQSP